MVSDGEWEETLHSIYEKYSGVMRSDQLLYQKEQRVNGERKASEPRRAKCSALYGYYHDENGCYADTEALGWVKQIFQMFMDGKNHLEIVTILNEANVPTLIEFYSKYDLTKRTEADHTWNSEKLAAIKRNTRYVNDCRCKKLCESLGRHCERKPIIDQETFDAVNAMFKYKNR